MTGAPRGKLAWAALFMGVAGLLLVFWSGFGVGFLLAVAAMGLGAATLRQAPAPAGSAIAVGAIAIIGPLVHGLLYGQ